jgi:DNA-binding transcriptional ArsR family regulator
MPPPLLHRPLTPMPHQDDVSAFAQSIAVIADVTRLRILFELLQGPTHAKRLAFVAQKDRKSIFYHLKVLERAGVIRTTNSDNQTEYCLLGSWVELEHEPRRGFQLRLGKFHVVLLPEWFDA